MDDYRERLFRETAALSKNIFISSIVLFTVAFLLSMAKIDWLTSIILAISFVMIFISWIVPGVFILFGRSWLAHAWLRGINPFGFPATPWKQLSLWHRFGVYFMSTLLFFAMVMAAIGFIKNIFLK